MVTRSLDVRGGSGVFEAEAPQVLAASVMAGKGGYEGNGTRLGRCINGQDQRGPHLAKHVYGRAQGRSRHTSGRPRGGR
jgi:hypothetical protein